MGSDRHSETIEDRRCCPCGGDIVLAENFQLSEKHQPVLVKAKEHLAIFCVAQHKCRFLSEFRSQTVTIGLALSPVCSRPHISGSCIRAVAKGRSDRPDSGCRLRCSTKLTRFLRPSRETAPVMEKRHLKLSWTSKRTPRSPCRITRQGFPTSLVWVPLPLP